MEFAEHQHRRVVMHMQLCGIPLWYPCGGYQVKVTLHFLLVMMQG